MKVKLMGVQKVDFTTEEGQQVVGNKLHVVSEDNENDSQFQGRRVAAIFTNLALGGFKPGDTIELVYLAKLGQKTPRLVQIVKV